MARRGRKDDTEERLAALRALAEDPRAEGARSVLEAALASGRGLLVARAARIVKENDIDDLRLALLSAFDALFEEPVKRDQGCEGKLAVAEALDQMDHLDPDPFLRGVRWKQPEPVWGRPVDTAANLRARCAFALVRMAWPDALYVLADLLADKELSAREAATRALAHHGGSGALALLRYKLHIGDEEAEVVAGCMSGILALDLEQGLELLPPRLRGDDPLLRELAALALGESRQDVVVPLLVELLDRAALSSDKKVALTALAVHRTEASRQVLLDRIATASATEARAAVKALSVQRFDSRTRALVEEAAGRNREVDLSAEIQEAFDD